MTDEFPLLLRGLIIGVSIAAPVGPIGILCIRRTLAEGRLVGFLSGLGAATADMVYGAIAAFGLTVIMQLLIDQAIWLRLVGGSFMLFLGFKTFLTKPTELGFDSHRSGLLGSYLSTLFLTLTNPMTILSFLAIFAGVMPAGARHSPMLLVIGVFSGSAFWWLTLSFGVGLVRDRLGTGLMVWINRLSGAIISVFAIILLLSRV